MKKNKKVSYTELDYHDIDDMVTKFLKDKLGDVVHENYECIAYEEWNNDECHKFHVQPKNVYGNVKKLKSAKNMDIFMFNLHSILNWMCIEGELEEGHYLINISW